MVLTIRNVSTRTEKVDVIWSVKEVLRDHYRSTHISTLPAAMSRGVVRMHTSER